MAVGIEGRRDQIVMGVAITAHHVIGRGAHGDDLGIAGQRRIVLLHQVEQAQRFGGKAVGKIEARQIQPRQARHFRAGMGGDLGQLAFGGQEAAARLLRPNG